MSNPPVPASFPHRIKKHRPAPPPLPTLPRPKATRAQQAFADLLRASGENCEQAEQITRLRDAVVATAIGSGETMGGAVIAVSGPRGGEGASLTSLLLARALAECVHRRIAWIDGSFDPDRFEVVSRILVLKKSAVTLSKGQTQLVGYANRRRPNAHFLRNESGEPSLDFFSDQRLGRFVSEVRRTFDFTIVDIPPILNSTASLFLLPLVDRLYLVAEPRVTSLADVEQCKLTAREAGGTISGVILNKQMTPPWSRLLFKSFFFA